ncbi:MAG: haloacid dehalogenase type II [Proteobacteria bacterium]|nr:haloacid dehalogenase type II [Pseudomonadota bacterium]
MQLDRRSFVTLGSASLVAPAAAAALAPSVSGKSIEAVAFDAFALFDPRPIFRACEAAIPDRGAELAQAWRGRQFEYQWLRALTGMYADFWSVTADALQFAAHSIHVDLSDHTRDELMHGYLTMRSWPEVPAALEKLRRSGRKLVVLSNATDAILNAGLANSGLTGTFQHVISTDRIKTFKPDPRAYRLGTQVLGLRAPQILFVAFAGWDAAGAGWFGYPTFWNNRLNAAAEELGVRPQGSGATLDELVTFLDAS